MSLEVRLNAYEGPLDLLLDLIKEKRIDIYDIPIALITKEYLEKLKALEEAELEVASEFVVMAATLMEIKARLLLPKEKKEEIIEEDPRLELVNRLLVYKQFKEAAIFFVEAHNEQSSIFSRENLNQVFLEELKPPEDLRNMQVKLSDLCQALQVALEAREEVLTELPREKITIEEQMNWLKLYLQEKKELHFQEIFSSLQSKVLIIVTFLALLELTHRGILGVRQNESTLDIYVFYLGEKTKEGPEIEATRS